MEVGTERKREREGGAASGGGQKNYGKCCILIAILNTEIVGNSQ